MKNIIKKILKEDRMYDETDDRFKEMIGKRVCITDPSPRDEGGNRMKPNGSKVCGELSFAGINDSHGQFQVTIGRSPYWPINPNNIKLQE
jgi:hypothetical protein